jgi:hypothetical protein
MRFYSSALLILVTAATAHASEPKTVEAVVAADDGWLKAEVSGDVQFLDRLLLPEYVSIGTDGTVTPKAKIVAHAGSRSAEERTKLQALITEWKATHDVRPQVTIIGDMAVLTWVVDKPGANDPVSSCDIFVYRAGGWHAIYSQHSTAAS